MRPNRALRWLLTRLSSRDAADATIGDLLEEIDERGLADRQPPSQRTRLNLRLLAAIGAAAAAASPTVLRTAGLTVRDAWRALRRAPAPSVFVFLCLAVALSVATVTFSVVDALVFRPLPFDHSERIVTISRHRLGDVFDGVTVPQFDAIRDHVGALDSVGIFRAGSGTTVTIGAATQSLTVAEATSDAFRVLRIPAIRGRVWSPLDEARRLDDVAVISERLWRDRFRAADTGVIGTHLGIFGRSYEIVGVLAGFDASGGDRRFSFDLCVPYSRQLAYEASHPFGRVFPFARLKPQVSIDDAAREINSIAAPMAPPDLRHPDQRLEVRGVNEQLVGDARGWLLLLLGAVGLVLAISTVNVANVMLAQSAHRSRELAVRASLGASPRQLAAAVLTESLWLSLLAGASALALTAGAIRAVVTALPPGRYLLGQSVIGVNGHVLVIGIGVSLLTGLFVGIVPAWQASRTSVVALLKDGGAGATRRSGWRSLFLVTETGSIGVLLVVCTLFITSFVRVLTLDLGFDRSHLLAVPRLVNYAGNVSDLKARLASLPGVSGVAMAGPTALPLVGSAFGGVWIDSPLEPSQNLGRGHSIDVDVYAVTPDMFDVAGIRFLQGATWAEGTPPSPRPMVLDEVAARGLFGTTNPIGQLVRAHDIHDSDFRVVGVVPYAYSRGPILSTPPSVYYAAAPSDPPGNAGFLVRTAGSPAALLPLVRKVVASSLPPAARAPEVYVVDDAFHVLTASQRFNATLMFALAFFALGIGAAGIYGVMSSIVAQQTKEIGVRVALGATTGDIRRRVLARAVRHVAAGLVLGLPAGWLISRGFASQFFQVKPTDASIYVIVAAVLTVVALAAAFVPARRAASVDPVVSLRAA